MSLSVDQKKKIAQFISSYRGWTAFFTGFLTGLFLIILTHNWQLLSISAIFAGLFATSYKKGIIYGSCSILAVYSLLLLFHLLTSPAMKILNVFIGLIGLTNMGFIALFISLLIGFLIGLTGGYLGATLHKLITWPAWS